MEHLNKTEIDCMHYGNLFLDEPRYVVQIFSIHKQHPTIMAQKLQLVFCLLLNHYG